VNTKPLIGLTPAYYEHKGMDRSILGKSYTDSIQQAGGLPVLIPPFIDPTDLHQLLRRLDAVILTGGDDLDPEFYGESSDPLTPQPFHPRRGQHDRQVFEYVWAHEVPTLAICLGLQEVNVFLGGSLYQDIPTQVTEPLVHKIGEWFEARHPVQLEQNALICRVTNGREVETNSAHHQAVQQVADKLKVTGRCPDGIVEALEPQDPSIPLLAVQWHPESEINAQTGLAIFKWLIACAGK